MADGYRVDLAALRTTAHGVRGVLAMVRADSAGPVTGAVGHDALAAALDGFVARWRDGCRALASDADVLADHLEADARAYEAAEASGAHALGPVLDGPGPDPAPG